METLRDEFNGIILDELEGTVKWHISFNNLWITYRGFVVGKDYETVNKEEDYLNDWIISSNRNAIKSVTLVKEKSSARERSQLKYRVEIRTGNNDIEIDPPFETREKAIGFYNKIMNWLNKK